MSILPVLIAPDPRLKLKSKPVKNVNELERKLIEDMLETMYIEPGIGLAAPQVGHNSRIIVIDISDNKEDRQPYRIVNPIITWVSEDDNISEEGCLSLPQQYAEVVRPRAIKVNYIDQNNVRQSLEADGLLATCLQHEIDHLEGILFVDHISALKRNMILRKLIKSKRGQN